MPLKKSPKGGGTNIDNSINKVYCVYCYEKGQFIQPDFAVIQMQESVKEKIKEKGIPSFLP